MLFHARDSGRRSPGSDAALGLIVEEPFSYERSAMVAAERVRRPRSWLRRVGPG